MRSVLSTTSVLHRTVAMSAVITCAAVLACTAASASSTAALAGQLTPGSVAGVLNAITATSAGNAWAVGATGGGQPMILRWAGTGWTRAVSPHVAGDGNLLGVAATSAHDAWAVGESLNRSGIQKSIMLHWNGTRWATFPIPVSARSGQSSLTSVTATSARNAWAVGRSSAGLLILHWNGSTWKRAV